MEIDWQVAEQIRQRYNDVISIFILPPSCKELEVRLKNRCQDSDEVIQRRLADAMSDMSHCCNFDYIVINDDFENALKDLVGIFQSKRLEASRVIGCKNPFIEELINQ